MAVLFMYLSFGVWVTSLAISMYATYRLYEYGPYNANLAWGILRQVTDIVTYIALGVALVLMVYVVNHWIENWLLITGIFIFGLLLARIIWFFSLQFVARPYIEVREKKRRHYKEVRTVKGKLKKEGRCPPEPKLLSEKDGWVKATTPQRNEK